MSPPSLARCKALTDLLVSTAEDAGYSAIEMACTVAALREVFATGQAGPEPAMAICHWEQAVRRQEPGRA